MKRFMALTASALTLSALFGITATSSAQVFSTPLYFTDGDGAIRSINTAGQVSQNPLATVANAGGFAFSDRGRSLFVANQTGIQRVNVATGAVSTFATGLSGVQSVVTDRFGNLYTTNAVLDNNNQLTARQVLRFTLAGGGVPQVVATLPTLTSTSATGADLAYDVARDLLYVQGQTAAGAGTIYRVATNTGTVANFATFATIPIGLTTNKAGQVFATLPGTSTMRRYGSEAAGASTLTGTTGANNGQLFITEDAFDEGTLPTPAGFFFDAAYDPSSDRTYGSSFASAPGANDGTIFSKDSRSTAGAASGAQVDITGLDPRRLAFAAVPAPSSVAVMAMGGLVPLVAFARRRRAAK